MIKNHSKRGGVKMLKKIITLIEQSQFSIEDISFILKMSSEEFIKNIDTFNLTSWEIQALCILLNINNPQYFFYTNR